MTLETERLILRRWEDSEAEDLYKYADGNTKSKRVQEKVGFKYQWTTEGVDDPLIHEKRTGNVNLMTKEDWLACRK